MLEWFLTKMPAIQEASSTAISIVSGLMAAYTAFTTTATGAQLSLSAAMMANPIGLIIAAIAALIAIGVAVVMNWDKIKDAAGKVGSWIGEKWEGIKNKTSEIWNGVKDTMNTAMNAAKDTVKEKLDNMKSAYEENGGGIKGAVAASWEGIKGFYTSGFDFVNKLTGGKLDGIKSAFTEKMNAAKDAVSSAFTKAKEFLLKVQEIYVLDNIMLQFGIQTPSKVASEDAKELSNKLDEIYKQYGEAYRIPVYEERISVLKKASDEIKNAISSANAGSMVIMSTIARGMMECLERVPKKTLLKKGVHNMNNKNKKHSGIKKSGDKVFRMPLISTKLAVSIFVTLVIIIVIIVIANLDYKVTSESLMGLSEFALTFIFTLAGLAFTIISIKPEIKQSDKNTFEINLNNYIISAFLAMMTVLFIYIYALFGVVGESNYMFIVLAIISMIFIFSRTWVLLTASYNIDGQNPN